jgi:hypothetical protein
MRSKRPDVGAPRKLPSGVVGLDRCVDREGLAARLGGCGSPGPLDPGHEADA